MPAFITFGRFLFAVLFIFSGATKLLDIAATTQDMAKLAMPAFISTFTAPYVAQFEGVTGMPIAQSMAISAGVVELICGLMIALNFGARFFAIVLILFVAVATYYFHDFWNQTGADLRNNLTEALKNLALIGGLFIIAGIGRSPRSLDPSYPNA